MIDTNSLYFLLCGLLIVSVFLGTQAYKLLAIQYGILANPNFRTLHQSPIPRGAGIVFSILFVCTYFIVSWLGLLETELTLAIGLGGFAAAVLGFVDDIADIRASLKLLAQILLSSWTLYCFDGGPLAAIEWLPNWISWLFSCFALVWLINLYNFMDGVDGMAISGAVFICLALALILFITKGSTDLMLILSLLAVCCVGFLLLNWPPASVFMGDSGSVFLGYSFGALVVYSTMVGEISIWTWLVVFGYFIGDTTTTTLFRIILVKRWYGAHRSHAYQNLARITGSHVKVTGGVLLYHLFWLLPLAIWSATHTQFEIWAALLALTPVVLFTFRYGPGLSSS